MSSDFAQTDPVVVFKRGKRRPPPQQKRKLGSDSDDSDGDDGSGVVADAASVAKKLRSGKAGFTSSSGGVSALKRRKEAEAAAAEKADDGTSKLDVSYATSGTAANLAIDSATRTLDVDAPTSQSKAPPPDILSGEAAESADNLYRGLSGYKEYVNKRTDSVTQSNASRIRAGPLKAAANVRLSTRFDYQPDICKDYKETGYCGYGDSCKFMHDRGDYKSGWQLDKEWDEKQKGREVDVNRFLINEGEEEEEVESEDELPFACVICREEFKEPVVTKCDHYFCESCALKHHAKSIKCFICGQPTQGLFKPAAHLQAKIKEKKKRAEEREKEIREGNREFEVDDEGEGEDA